MAGEQRQQPREERAIVMEYTTGLPTAKFADLLTLIRLREEDVEGYPPSLGLRDSLRAVLIYMRHNVIQAVIGEQLGVSQSTISRAIGAVTDAIVRALKDVLLTAEEVPQGCDYVVDGTLYPLLELAQSPRIVVGQTQDDRHERPDPDPAGRPPGAGFRSLSGVHARRGRPRRLPDCSRESTPPGGSPTRAISEGE